MPALTLKNRIAFVLIFIAALLAVDLVIDQMINGRIHASFIIENAIILVMVALGVDQHRVRKALRSNISGSGHEADAG